jgi:hypothetical protein
MSDVNQDLEFSHLLLISDDRNERAPASLKARLYTAFVREQQQTGRLASLDATVAAGRDICIFEKLVQVAPIGEGAKSPFFCNTCHARVLAEIFDNPPIFWPHCPYSDFKKS